MKIAIAWALTLTCAIGNSPVQRANPISSNTKNPPALRPPSAATSLVGEGVTSLVISNHSFEFPAIPTNSFSVSAPPPGWVSYGSINNNNRSVGVLDPAGSTLYAVPPPHGENVGVTFLMDNPANQIFFANIEAGLRQTLAATLQTKRRYTLRVEVGNIANDVNAPFAFAGFPNYRIDLLAGTNVLASDHNSLLPGEGRFLISTVTVDIAASNPFAEQLLGIRLVNLNNAPGIEVNWDNVRLDWTHLGPPPIALVGAGTSWKYLDNQIDQGTAWRAPEFDDSSWSNGVAQLGFGDDDEVTEFRRLIGETPIITAYFRRTFVAPDPRNFSELRLRLLRDDGGVVYLNGTEVFRSNMPEGPISYGTYAVNSISTGPEEGLIYFSTNLPPNLLVTGTNTLAVEIHQVTQFSSTDMSFDCELLGHRNSRPLLAVLHETLDGELRFSWPDTGGGVFSVQSATNLTAPIMWTPLSSTPVLNEGIWAFTIPTPACPHFFRLQSP